MNGKPANTEQYFATLDEQRRVGLHELREAIRAAAPGVEEAFSYGMPAFRLGGKPLVWYAAWKRHYGLYPVSAAMLRAHAAEAEGYETSKGTIRFPAARPVPRDLVQTLVKARVAELHGREA